jgi:hypothetical protein
MQLVKLKAIVGILIMIIGTLAVKAQTGWQQKVTGELPFMGHRNWIVIVNSAHPLQCSSGVETIEREAQLRAKMKAAARETAASSKS